MEKVLEYLESLKALISNKLASFSHHIDTLIKVSEETAEHRYSRGNVHGTTKEKMGVLHLENYGIATPDIIESGTSNEHYVDLEGVDHYTRNVGIENSVVFVPTIISPKDNADLNQLAPQLIAGTYKHLFNIERALRKFEIEDTNTGEVVFEGGSDADSLTLEENLSPSTPYRWRCKDVAVDDTESLWSTWEYFSTLDMYVLTPNLVSSSDPTNSDLTFTLTTDPFGANNYTDEHVSTTWIITQGNTTVFESIDDVTNLTELNIGPGVLLPNTFYTVTVYHTGKDLGKGGSKSINISTLNAYIEKPTVAVSGGSNAAFVVPLLTISAFSPVGFSDEFEERRVIIYDEQDSIIWQANQFTSEQSVKVDVRLEELSNYRLEVSYKGKYLGWSENTTLPFTTGEAFIEGLYTTWDKMTGADDLSLESNFQAIDNLSNGDIVESDRSVIYRYRPDGTVVWGKKLNSQFRAEASFVNPYNDDIIVFARPLGDNQSWNLARYLYIFILDSEDGSVKLRNGTPLVMCIRESMTVGAPRFHDYANRYLLFSFYLYGSTINSGYFGTMVLDATSYGVVFKNCQNNGNHSSAVEFGKINGQYLDLISKGSRITTSGNSASVAYYHTTLTRFDINSKMRLSNFIYRAYIGGGTQRGSIPNGRIAHKLEGDSIYTLSDGKTLYSYNMANGKLLRAETWSWSVDNTLIHLPSSNPGANRYNDRLRTRNNVNVMLGSNLLTQVDNNFSPIVGKVLINTTSTLSGQMVSRNYSAFGDGDDMGMMLAMYTDTAQGGKYNKLVVTDYTYASITNGLTFLEDMSYVWRLATPSVTAHLSLNNYDWSNADSSQGMNVYFPGDSLVDQALSIWNQNTNDQFTHPPKYVVF